MGSSNRYSVSLPEELAEEIRSQVGAGWFSACGAEALEQGAAMDRVREIVADFETDNAPLTREEVQTARARLRHTPARGSAMS